MSKSLPEKEKIKDVKKNLYPLISSQEFGS